jgi:hypothetical protein
MNLNPFAGWIAGGTLVAFVGLFGIMKAGEMARAHERDTAISQRDKSDDKGDLICNQARSSFRVYDRLTGKPLPRAEWGKDCKVAVFTLQQRVDGERERLAEALAADRAEQDAKYRADLAAARRNATRQSTSLKALEAADATITDGHYPAHWWRALGDTLGLRPAAEADAALQPGPAGRDAEGSPIG